MPEHRIRFRGGWEWSFEGDPPGNPRKLSLPTRWEPNLLGPIRLSRRFGSPPIDPSTEFAWLELKAVPGLRRATLNEVDLGPPPAGDQPWTLPLAGLLADRNTLILEVEPPGESAEEWGAIALLIAPSAGPGG